MNFDIAMIPIIKLHSLYVKFCLLVSFVIILLNVTLGFSQEITKNPEQVDSIFSQLKTELSNNLKSNDSLKISSAYIHLADFYSYLGISNEAVKSYHDALDYNVEDDTTEVYILNKIGGIHWSLKQYDVSRDYLERSLKISEVIHYGKGKAIALAQLGSVAEKESHYNVALDFQKKSLELFQSLEDSTGLALAYENLGSIYEDLEDYHLAESYFKKAYSYAQKSPLNYQINIINNLGDVNRKAGKLEEALKYTSQALDLSKSSNNGHQEESALKDMSRTFDLLGDYKQAFKYMNQHSLVNEQEILKRSTELVSALQILYEVQERDTQLELLKNQNQLNQIQKRILIVVSVFIIIALLGLYVYSKKRNRQRANIQVYKQQLLQADLDKKTAEEESLKREVNIKLSSLTSYSLHLAHKNKMLADISRTLSNLKNRNAAMIQPKLQELVADIDSDLQKEQEWTEFMHFFEQVNPDFFKNLNQVATSELSPAEIRLCMLLRLNLSSKEIASILRITSDSVRIARYRLRKKLPMNSKDDLQSFLLHL